MSKETDFEKAQAETHEHGDTTGFKIAPIAHKRGHMHHPRSMTGKHPNEKKPDQEKGQEAESEQGKKPDESAA